MKITEINIYLTPVDQKTDTLARVKIVLDNELIINDLRIIKGKFGPFIAWPRNDKARENIAFPITARLSNEFSAAIFLEYNRQKGIK